MQITYPLLIIGGFIIGFILSWIIEKINKRRKHNLEGMKELVKDTHACLKQAAENQVKLYKIFNEIGEGIE